jgi:3-methyladenine DNA glycosylase AlkD
LEPVWQRLLDDVTVVFEAARNPAEAGPMRAYMRDQFFYLGLRKPEREALERPIYKALTKDALDQAALVALARACWDRDEREYQYFALSVLRRFARHLGPDFIDTAQFLITTRSWWDSVDEISHSLVGPLVARHHELVAVMDRWIEHDNLWLRRTAILHQNRYRADTDRARLFRYCLAQAHEKEFFIRKAIGWALRDYAKTEPDAVRAFVEQNDERLSGLSKREALKHL